MTLVIVKNATIVEIGFDEISFWNMTCRQLDPYPFRYCWQWNRRYLSQIHFQTEFSFSSKLLWSDFPSIWTHVVFTTTGHPTGVISRQTLFWNYENIASNKIKEIRFKNLNLFCFSITRFNRFVRTGSLTCPNDFFSVLFIWMEVFVISLLFFYNAFLKRKLRQTTFSIHHSLNVPCDLPSIP